MYNYVINREANAMTRREAREALFVLLYEMTFNSPEELESTVENASEDRDLSDAYILSTARGVYEKKEEIDARISENARGWTLSRMSRTTLSILRISIYEMLFGNIPYNVSINEAVELAKKYDHDQAPTFINGILNTIALKAGLKDK